MTYTEKQKQLLKIFKNGELKRINLLQGSVRSGKTWISLVLWGFWLLSMPKHKTYLMVGKTLTSLKRNCLDIIEELFGKKHVFYSLSQKEALILGRKVYLEGVNDARAESKIRGMTLQGAYCDEITLFTEDFFSMLLSRLSEKGAKLLGTTNPDHPKHWLKEKYIDRKDTLDMLVMDFFIDDNTKLSNEYVTELKKEYTGVFYDRFILGKWVVAEGAIYREYIDNEMEFITKREDIPKLLYINIGVDFGGNGSNHAIVATGIDSNMKNVYVLRAQSLRATGTNVEYIVKEVKKNADIIKNEFGFVDVIYCDSAEQAIINTIKSNLSEYKIRGSIKKRITDRIRATDVLMSQRRLHLLKGETKALADGFKGAVWNSKKLTDERLDNGTSDIDVLDAFEYSFEHYIPQLLRENK